MLFPLFHPAAALHQGSLIEPLREDFKKLKAYLENADRETGPSESSSPSTKPEPQQVQMDLFGA